MMNRLKLLSTGDTLAGKGSSKNGTRTHASGAFSSLFKIVTSSDCLPVCFLFFFSLVFNHVVFLST